MPVQAASPLSRWDLSKTATHFLRRKTSSRKWLILLHYKRMRGLTALPSAAAGARLWVVNDAQNAGASVGRTSHWVRRLHQTSQGSTQMRDNKDKIVFLRLNGRFSRKRLGHIEFIFYFCTRKKGISTFYAGAIAQLVRAHDS